MFETKNDKNVVIFIQRKIHLIDNFKFNILFDNDIIDVEKFNIDMIVKRVVIKNIDALIFFDVNSSKIAFQRFVYLRQIIIVSSYTQMTISIYNVCLSISRNFLFESNDDVKLIMYAHFVDVNTISILIRNDKIVFVKISKNFRFDRFFEFDFSNVYYIENVENDDRHLIVKKSKTIHKNE